MAYAKKIDTQAIVDRVTQRIQERIEHGNRVYGTDIYRGWPLEDLEDELIDALVYLWIIRSLTGAGINPSLPSSRPSTIVQQMDEQPPHCLGCGGVIAGVAVGSLGQGWYHPECYKEGT